MTKPTREQVMTEALELAALLPTLIERYPDDADFWPAYAAIADPIMAAAGQVEGDPGVHEDVFLVFETTLWHAGKFDPGHVLQT